MFRVFLLIFLLLAIYVLPQVLALSAAIRLAFGLHTNRLKMAAALVLELPAVAMVQSGRSPMFTRPDDWNTMLSILFTSSAAATLAGCFLWWVARRGLVVRRYWIEAILITAVIAYQFYSVDSWIAR